MRISSALIIGALVSAAALSSGPFLASHQSLAAATPPLPKLTGNYSVAITKLCQASVTLTAGTDNTPSGDINAIGVNIQDAGLFKKQVGTVTFTSGKTAGAGTIPVVGLTEVSGSLLTLSISSPASISNSGSGGQAFTLTPKSSEAGTYLEPSATELLLCTNTTAACTSGIAKFDFTAAYTLVGGIVQHAELVAVTTDTSAPNNCVEYGSMDLQ